MDDRDSNPGGANAGASRDDSGGEQHPYTEKSAQRLGVASEAELYRRHPYYQRILNDALALLRSNLQAFAREYTWDELCSRGNGWKLRNTLGVAVIRARDTLGVKRHGVANHENTVRDLRRICCGQKGGPPPA